MPNRYPCTRDIGHVHHHTYISVAFSTLTFAYICRNATKSVLKANWLLFTSNHTCAQGGFLSVAQCFLFFIHIILNKYIVKFFVMHAKYWWIEIIIKQMKNRFIGIMCGILLKAATFYQINILRKIRKKVSSLSSIPCKMERNLQSMSSIFFKISSSDPKNLRNGPTLNFIIILESSLKE